MWWTHELSQLCFNMTDTNLYVSPKALANLGYAMYDNQVCNYLVILSSSPNQTQVMVIQIKFHN